MKKFLIIAAAGAALAAGVPAALAATDSGQAQAPAATFQPVQQEQDTPQPERSRPDRGDCPETDGASGGEAATTATPEI